MRFRKSIVLLCAGAALLAVAASGTGFFLSGGDGPAAFTTHRGQTAQTYGRGLYRNDSLLIGSGLHGTDAVTLFVAVPFLIVTLLLYASGSLRGGFLMAGALSYMLYNAASLALGAAYNSLFLVYVASFSVSLFAFISTLAAVDLPAIAARLSPSGPRRGIAVFLFVSGAVLTLVWLLDLVGAIAAGVLPANLAGYTTLVTYVLDLGVIAPALFFAAVLVLRRSSLGYLLACVLLVLESLMGFVVVAQTIAQVRAGVHFTPQELAVFSGSFVAMSLAAAWFFIAALRAVPRSLEVGGARS